MVLSVSVRLTQTAKILARISHTASTPKMAAKKVRTRWCCLAGVEPLGGLVVPLDRAVEVVLNVVFCVFFDGVMSLFKHSPYDYTIKICYHRERKVLSKLDKH